jgi:hypothetical protein
VVTTDLEGDMVVLGVDLSLLRREAAGVLRLQQVDADPVVEQPDIYIPSYNYKSIEGTHTYYSIQIYIDSIQTRHAYQAPPKSKEPGRRMGTKPSTSV